MTTTTHTAAFETGKSYFGRFICNYDTTLTITVTKLTACFVTFELYGETRRAKIQADSYGPYVVVKGVAIWAHKLAA